MAALTFFSNFYSDPSSINPQFPYFSPEMSPDLFFLPPPHLDYVPAMPDDSVLFPTVAPFFDDASPFLFSDVYPYFSAEIFPFDEFEFHYSKRQRIVLEQSFCYGGVGGNVGGGCGGGGGGGYFPLGLLDGRMDNAEMMNNSNCSKTKQLPSSSNASSVQTIAARERRRRITAKTQELGELIPGGVKMNTAEMLNSAFKYVKFLQAQVAILQLKQETEHELEEQETEDLQILDSAMIQEKLYSEEQCLVPKGFVQNLANFPEIQSHPFISNSINQILKTSG
ncbi:uncharacterized protein LOC111490459 [Cucurbita maxima]|uniref:Uncharacterized protein LOC111490459 n=1 Tax=Cucurbita maxima TaxID=3661 RepID=A0A6J1K695_CUCMA|nr:uncharacterized protein LOC111490459 [Cucurbita maxima]